MVVKKKAKRPVKKKAGAKKRGSGLVKYQTAVKRATATTTKAITALEKRILVLKKVKAKKVKEVRRKLKK